MQDRATLESDPSGLWGFVKAGDDCLIYRQSFYFLLFAKYVKQYMPLNSKTSRFRRSFDGQWHWDAFTLSKGSFTLTAHLYETEIKVSRLKSFMLFTASIQKTKA